MRYCVNQHKNLSCQNLFCSALNLAGCRPDAERTQRARFRALAKKSRRSVAGSPTREQAARKGGFNRGLVLPPIVFLSFLFFFFVFKP
ncbi:hypothetical protein CEP82_006475 [Mobiluncus mulieris]|nr:hypothetical protein CEP82_006475 [Mobiluncus mulieris]